MSAEIQIHACGVHTVVASRSRGTWWRAVLGGRLVMVCAVLAAGLSVVGVSSAFAGSPWWKLTSGLRPSSVQPGSALDEVQTLTISATGGDFTLERDNGNGHQGGFTEISTLKFDASNEEVQAALEAAFGAGNVRVASGPGGASPYTITFTGELADQPIDLLRASGGAKVVETTHGRADGEIYVTALNVGDASFDGGVAPLRVTDVLPSGLRAVGISGHESDLGDENAKGGIVLGCTRAPLACTFEGVMALFISRSKCVSTWSRKARSRGKITP